jgi:[glutamine synthetase] adenylyltransferase / [glutamine synthetase]-adenylyl-L-tyrosine phosphorylase
VSRSKGALTGNDQKPLAAGIIALPRLPLGRRNDLVGAWLAEVGLDEAGRKLGEMLAVWPQARRLLGAIFAHSPFLTRIITTHTGWLLEALAESARAHLDRLIGDMRRACANAANDDEIMPVLRHTRQRTALLVALADLGGLWPLDDVTEALTRFADEAVSLSTDHILREAQRANQLVLPDMANPSEASGYVLIAMGKHGAGELNYSSDIDLIAIHDSQRAIVTSGIEPAELFTRLTRRIVRLLQSRTADDYVLRVDLRLRPDPSSTPPSVPLAAAYQYYETVGQNWERAAFIKARPVAGDIAMGRRFLDDLAPFVWRRHLDFQAIADLRGLWRDVRAVHGDDETISGRNVKLGPGGIRECELATQSLQLVFGGRNSQLRGPRTLGMLKALAEAGHLPNQSQRRLTDAYLFLRKIEHRLQMRHDEQTQILPRDEELENFARWSGFASSKAFEKALARHTSQVRAEAEKAFGVREERPRAGVASLTTKRLGAMGFRKPAKASRLIAQWSSSAERSSTRAARARQALAALRVDLIEAFAATDDPDAAIAAFDRAFDRIAAPAELFSILAESEPLRRLFATMLGSAPRLAEAIVQRPHLLDIFIDVRALAQEQTLRRVETRIQARVATARSHEEALDLLRDAGREEWFLAGARFLGGNFDAAELGAAYTIVAEASLRVALDITRKGFAAEHGLVRGARMAVLAMGRLGSEEMTATSDLDLIVIYDMPKGADLSDGRRPLDPVLYFSRLTHRLITAVAAPTSHGMLYDIDMRLRPSGGKGPVALSLSAFADYQMREAETWEHLALTRARPVAGDLNFCRQVATTVRRVLAVPRDCAMLARDVAAMRRLVAKEKGDDDAADLKNMRGGLVDIEFCIQFLVVAHAAKHVSLIASPDCSLVQAAKLGVISGSQARQLSKARSLFIELLQRERLRSTAGSSASWNDAASVRGIARELRFPSGAALVRSVDELRADVAAIYKEVVRAG